MRMGLVVRTEVSAMGTLHVSSLRAMGGSSMGKLMDVMRLWLLRVLELLLHNLPHITLLNSNNSRSLYINLPSPPGLKQLNLGE
jgi:hypothetical protein